LGYSIHETYRRGKDAVVVGYKKGEFTIVDQLVVDYNDLAKYYTNMKDMNAKDFLAHNKALICLI